MVEGEVGGSDVGQVGGDVARRDVDLAILHVFRMHELDVVDQAQFVEQYGTDEAVKVTARDETEFLLGHWMCLRLANGLSGRA